MIKLDANLYINQDSLCLELICLANTLVIFCVPPYSLKLLTPPQRRTFVEISGGETDPASQTMGPVSYSSETYDLVSWAWLCLITGMAGRAGVG